MELRILFALLACCAMLSTGIGFAASELSQPESAGAAKSNALIGEMRKTNRWLRLIAGGQGVLHGDLQDIDANTEPYIGKTAAQLLYDIGGNTEPYIGYRAAQLLYDIERNTSP